MTSKLAHMQPAALVRGLTHMRSTIDAHAVTLIRMTKDEKGLAFYKGLLL
jgi:hypothetical protein